MPKTGGGTNASGNSYTTYSNGSYGYINANGRVEKSQRTLLLLIVFLQIRSDQPACFKLCHRKLKKRLGVGIHVYDPPFKNPSPNIHIHKYQHYTHKHREPWWESMKGERCVNVAYFFKILVIFKGFLKQLQIVVFSVLCACVSGHVYMCICVCLQFTCYLLPSFFLSGRLKRNIL